MEYDDYYETSLIALEVYWQCIFHNITKVIEMKMVIHHILFSINNVCIRYMIWQSPNQSTLGRLKLNITMDFGNMRMIMIEHEVVINVILICVRIVQKKSLMKTIIHNQKAKCSSNDGNRIVCAISSFSVICCTNCFNFFVFSHQSVKYV